jgi:hypothetical protein
MIHRFSVIVSDSPQSEQEMLDLADAIGNEGCLDSSVGGHEEGSEVSFHREAESLDAAIKSAIADVERAGCQVKRVELGREAISLDT